MKVFCKKEILLQYSVLSYRIDLYFPRHRLAIEVDEKRTQRQINMKKLKDKKQ